MIKQRTQVVLDMGAEIVNLQKQHEDLGLKINERLVSYQQFLEGVKIIPPLGENAMSRTPAQKEAASRIRKATTKKKGRRPSRSPKQREADVIKACSSKDGCTITEARLAYGATRLIKDANRFLKKAKKEGRLRTKTVTVKSKSGRMVTGERWFAV